MKQYRHRELTLFDIAQMGEDACKEHLALTKWNGKPVCPYCENDKCYTTKTRYKCAKCRRLFSVTVGTGQSMKLVVNPPKARVVESHGNEDPSSTAFHFHEGIWATILNEGGGGKVLVKATLKQDGNVYVKTDFAYLGDNQTKEFHFDFTEPSRFGGKMEYGVVATSME